MDDSGESYLVMQASRDTGIVVIKLHQSLPHKSACPLQHFIIIVTIDVWKRTRLSPSLLFTALQGEPARLSTMLATVDLCIWCLCRKSTSDLHGIRKYTHCVLLLYEWQKSFSPLWMYKCKQLHRLSSKYVNFWCLKMVNYKTSSGLSLCQSDKTRPYCQYKTVELADWLQYHIHLKYTGNLRRQQCMWTIQTAASFPGFYHIVHQF